MKKHNLTQSIQPFFFTFFCYLAIFRLIELTATQALYGFQTKQFLYETMGLGLDLLYACLFSLVISPLIWLTGKISKKLTITVLGLLLLVAIFVQIAVVSFYIVQLYPVDTFIFHYTKKEILYTVTTSGVEPYIIIAGLFVFAILILLTFKFFYKKAQQHTPSHRFFIYLLFGSIAYISIASAVDLKEKSNYLINKSAFIFQRTIEYAIENKQLNKPYQTEYTENYQETFNHHTYISKEYPYLHEMDTNDVWENLFEPFDTFPNIVFLLVEGLNDDFIHPIEGIELMPFLSEVKNKSIYYNRAFTLGERSFATLPTSVGGLPYGEKGFMLQPSFPNLMSLIGILKQNGYLTSYFHGQNGWFHNKDGFLRECGIDIILDNKGFDEKYEKILVGEDNFFWGYNDWDLMAQALEITDTINNRSRFDIFITGSTHAPFRIANEAYYDQYYDSLMLLIPESSVRKKELVGRKKNYKTLLFADDAFKMYFNELKKRPDYSNTIFIITGDHPMTEVYIENSLKRYHVPILIYSEKLKNPIVSNQTVSQLDLYETLLSFLRKDGLKTPTYSASIGSKLDIKPSNKSKKLAFMNDNREIVDYLSDGYYITRGNLYKVNEDLSIEKSSNSAMKDKLKKELITFKRTNYFSTKFNKLYPDSLSANYYHQKLIANFEEKFNETFSSEYANLFVEKITVNKTLNIKFQLNYSTNKNSSRIIVQINDSDNNVVHWESQDLSSEQHAIYRNLQIPIDSTKGSNLELLVYLYNENNKVQVSYFNCRVTTSL